MTTIYDPDVKEEMVRKYFYSKIELYDRECIENDYPNIYHKYLNLPFTITRPDICYGSPAEAKITNLGDYRDPNIEKLHQELGIKTFIVEVVYTPPNSNLPIHSDLMHVDNHIKLNLSWGDSDKSATRWWMPKDITTPVLSTPINPDREDYDLIYKATTNSPCLINVGQLHDSYNPSDEGRWTLSFIPAHQNNNLIQWEEAMQIYKDYIYD
ncbi:MAG: hypothetical protein EBU66_07415 [Bacteroidetes bacterium]|nr:hypothetical protein [bacterium]NBP64473.1 hypothetical protein [Bacteroidota bacterium]